MTPEPAWAFDVLTARLSVMYLVCNFIINNNNNRQYRRIANSHIFVPVAIESAGTWNHQAVELVEELGRRMTAVTEDPREAT